MEKLLEILNNKRSSLLSLFQLRKNYRNSVYKNSTDLDLLIKKSYSTYRLMIKYINNYKLLMSINDAQLRLLNSNSRIKFLYDQFFCHSNENEKQFFFKRNLTATDYFSIAPKVRSYSDDKYLAETAIPEPIETIIIYCMRCGLEIETPVNNPLNFLCDSCSSKL